MDERERRIGLNQSVFRQVNERLEEVSTRLGRTGEQLDLVCECGNASCAERIAMPVEQYEGIRRDGALFAVVPGHAARDVEEVLLSRRGYEVVRKRPGRPTALAEETDPRR